MTYRVKTIDGLHFLYKKVWRFYVPCYTFAVFGSTRVIERIKHASFDTIVSYCKAVAKLKGQKYQKMDFELNHVDIHFIDDYDFV